MVMDTAPMDIAAVALYTTLSHKCVVLHIKRITFSHAHCVLHICGLNSQLIGKNRPTAKFHHFQHPQIDKQTQTPPTCRIILRIHTAVGVGTIPVHTAVTVLTIVPQPVWQVGQGAATVGIGNGQ